MSKKVFIDGKSGTTGLRIYQRLEQRENIELITLGEEQRRDVNARKQALNQADVAFLCLPDEAAVQSVSLVENPDTVIIDTSTAHRTNPGWAYAFSQLSAEHYSRIKTAKRIAVPGCHASGFIALVYPLVQQELLDRNSLLSCTSITGYSGGGKPMIADYEANGHGSSYSSPKLYGLTQQHKHLKEMQTTTGLSQPPVFCPVVAPFYSGMLVTVGLFTSQLKPGTTKKDVADVYAASYQGPVVRYVNAMDEAGFVSSNGLCGLDCMEITVLGNGERLVLAARYDNLGKGASGAAIEAMNIVLETEETTGLIIDRIKEAAL
ncbi:MAG: N-acetyl-gamma-glutamyl-phosphate reductase [Angelakisella sp.]|nr:N-acetyl-gamma-glutamyl-phosphate reductase [Angelakisella sp.]